MSAWVHATRLVSLLAALTSLVDAIAARISRVVLTALLFAALLGSMLLLGGPFQSETGFAPFDFQGELTVADVRAQLPHYGERARQIYVAISILDFAFPLVAALLWSALISAGLRQGCPGWYSQGHGRLLLLLPFFGTLADYAENVANLWLVAYAPEVIDVAAEMSVAAKKLKLAAVPVSMIAGAGTLALGWTMARLRSRADRRAP